MINIYLFLSLLFIFTFLFGRLLQKIRVPWIFSALLLGVVLSIHNPFTYITNSETFVFLANLGMYFLLFMIGFETNLQQIKEKKAFIFKSTFFIIFLEAILGSLIIHFVFDYTWFVSFIVALSFSTVGEAILVPILDEFKIINTRLGQTILSIGTIDDVIEIFILILVILFTGSKFQANLDIWFIVLSLFALFILTFALNKFKKQREEFHFVKIETLFLLVIAILFLFLGIGAYAEAMALGAILAGVSIKTFIPKERLGTIESEIKSVAYGLFAPIFFLWVGIELNMEYLITYPLLIILVVLVSSGAKYFASFIAGRKELGVKNSLLLGTGLSVRFSTSIVVIKILYENKIIENDLYSVIIASSIIFTFVIPILFSQLLKNSKVQKNRQ
jgi:Ca2+-transporting ATPase